MTLRSSAPADSRPSASRALVVLVGLTFVALVLVTYRAQDVLSIRGASAVAAVLAFAKVRFVIADFMELRGTPQQRMFDVWLAIVGIGSVILFLR